MAKNKFFSNIWFRCITVLLIISCCSGALLAVLNDVLYVSPEERTARAIKQVYGEEKQYETIIDVDFNDSPIEYEEYGKINKVFLIGDKQSGVFDYLIQSVGYKGYKNGTVTLWVQIQINQNSKKINSVTYASGDKQTLMSKFTQEYYDFFSNDFIEEIERGLRFEPFGDSEQIGHPNTGATKSATAVCNAINAVIEYAWVDNFMEGK